MKKDLVSLFKPALCVISTDCRGDISNDTSGKVSEPQVDKFGQKMQITFVRMYLCSGL